MLCCTVTSDCLATLFHMRISVSGSLKGIFSPFSLGFCINGTVGLVGS